VIGAPLEARVSLSSFGETYELLRRHEADLPMLFITSQVALQPGTSPKAGPDGGTAVAVSAAEAVTVQVEKAEGTKCLRCWRFQTDISSEPEFAGICGRCVEAVKSNRR